MLFWERNVELAIELREQPVGIAEGSTWLIGRCEVCGSHGVGFHDSFCIDLTRTNCFEGTTQAAESWPIVGDELLYRMVQGFLTMHQTLGQLKLLRFAHYCSTKP
jgi:hypothetical protein